MKKDIYSYEFYEKLVYYIDTLLLISYSNNCFIYLIK